MNYQFDLIKKDNKYIGYIEFNSIGPFVYEIEETDCIVHEPLFITGTNQISHLAFPVSSINMNYLIKITYINENTEMKKMHILFDPKHIMDTKNNPFIDIKTQNVYDIKQEKQYKSLSFNNDKTIKFPTYFTDKEISNIYFVMSLEYIDNSQYYKSRGHIGGFSFCKNIIESLFSEMYPNFNVCNVCSDKIHDAVTDIYDGDLVCDIDGDIECDVCDRICKMYIRYSIIQ